MFDVQFTPDAVEDLRWLRKAERRQVLAELELQLRFQPAGETRKRLRPNQLAEWELRVGRFRVFFDADPRNNLIKVVAVGYKRGSRLFIHGKEYLL